VSVRFGGDPLRQVVAAIAVITVVSGGVQLLAPGFVLGVIDGESTAGSRHFFAIVGMFMVVVGGLLLHGLLTPPLPAYVALWTGLQKLGAATAVGLGVANEVFGALALLVAGFDLLSGALIGLLWWRLRVAS